MSLKQVRRTIIVLILIILSGISGYWLRQRQIGVKFEKLKPEIRIERAVPVGKENVDFDLFWEVWDRLEAEYLDKTVLDPGEMVYGAIKGMAASLKDPYTVFLPPQKNKESKDDLAGQFEGVGIQLGYKDSVLAVIAPLSGTPAEKAEVKAGDLIVNIRDEEKGVNKETAGMSLPEAVTLIRGPKGTPVVLTLAREGTEELLEKEVIRGTIVVKSVEVELVDAEARNETETRKQIAHLKLLRFGERTNQEWETAVAEIRSTKSETRNFKGVILDLRNNPGGFLSGAVWIASEFLDGGPPAGRQVVVQQDGGLPAGRQGDNRIETFSVNRQGQLTDVPLVVLVNKGSASASEIVAGALQYHGRAKIVGEKTFGKGTIQEAQDLEGGAGLHITIARWLLPDGTSVDKEGITPDVEVEMDKEDSTKDPQLEKAMKLLTDAN